MYTERRISEGMRSVVLMMVTKKMTAFREEGGTRFLRKIRKHLTTQHQTPEDSYFDFTKLSLTMQRIFRKSSLTMQ
jgi:hypothetical protein